MRFFFRVFRALVLSLLMTAVNGGCTDGNQVVSSYRASSLYTGGALGLDPKELVTGQNKNIPIQWTTAADTPLYRYHLKLSYSKRVVFEKELKESDLINNGKRSYKIPTTLNDGLYQVELYAYDDWGRKSNVELGSVIVDTTPPVVHLFLGAESSADPCAISPNRRSNVATRLVPFEYCAQDPGKNPSGVTGLCLRRNSDDRSLPAAGDTCWEKPSELLKLALLQNGENKVQLFAKDQVGNTAQVPFEETKINLNIGHPPQVDILLPTSVVLSQEKWRAGEQKTIKWRITDDDTAYEQIKLIVTLVEVASPSNFRHLACNFANSVLWKQCPELSIENSTLIKREAESNSGSITFTVPYELRSGVAWDENKKYLVLISAIDKSGNAAVGSPAEINAGWEVLAGRTYKGIGGSGTTIQKLVTYNPTHYIATDKKGQLFDITNSYKINAFDYRTCRFKRTSASDLTAFDCADAIETALPIQSYPWVYNPDKDIFYSVTKKGALPVLTEIDFNQRKVSIIMGEGSTPITPAVPSTTKSEALSSAALSMYLYYDTVSKVLFFRSAGAFYKMNGANEVQYLFGTELSAEYPPNQISKAQKDLVLPTATPFIVTKDLRLFFGGSKLTTTPHGSGYGLQYVIDSISLTDSGHPANLLMVSPNGGVVNKADPRFDYVNGINYDPKRDRVLGSLSWRGIYQMTVPALGSPASAYEWKALALYAPQKLSEPDQIDSLPSSPVFPYEFYMYARSGFAYAGADFLYFVNGVTASILNLDLNSAALDRTVGFSIGNEPDQLAINRRLDTPHSLFLDNDGKVVFNDFYNLNRIENTEVGSNPIIHTLVKRFPKQNLKFNSGANQVLQSQAGTLAIYDYLDLSKAPQKLSVASQDGYEIQYGIGNNFLSPKTVRWHTNWDYTRGLVRQSFLTAIDYVTNLSSLLSVSDGFSHGYSYCGDPANPVACESGLPELEASGGSYYSGSDFRLIPRSGHLEWHDRVGQIAFDATDSNIYSCLNSKFAKVNLSTHKIYLYEATTSNGAPLTCSPTGAIFDFIRGEIYYGEQKAIYRVDTSRIETNNQAVLSQVQTVAPLLPGSYGDFEITADYVYYTEKNSSRVLRNRRLP